MNPHLSLCLLLAACSSPTPARKSSSLDSGRDGGSDGGSEGVEGPEHPVPLIEGPNFFDRPYPHSERTIDGSPDISDFPMLADYPLLQGYVEVAAGLGGFANGAPIYVRTDRPLEADLLPDAAASMSEASPIRLIDIDVASPTFGQNYPFDAVFQQEATHWQPANLLSLVPLPGAPLRPATQYAVVLDSAHFSSPLGWTLADAMAQSPELAELAALGIGESDVAFAWAFHTQEPRSELARIADHLPDADVPPIAGELRFSSAWEGFITFEGTLQVPIWMHGEAPYTTTGGGFEFVEDIPQLATLETITFTLSLPLDYATRGPLPVVLVSNGTGANHDSFADCADDDCIANTLAEAGLAGLGISHPLQGDRYVGGSIDLISFNVFNPEAGRTIFQQSASDLISIAGRLALAPPTFTVRDGEYPAPQLDTQKMGFFGHSQGGQVGSMALPWFPLQVRAVVISGAGGGVALSAVQRDSSDFDIQALIKTTFEFAPEETLTTAHPLMGLVQLIGEATDPSNFGASWWSEPGPASPSARSVLHIEGVEDPYTPASVSEALAGAALLPVVNELHSSSGILEMRGGPVEVAPILTNRTGWDGQPVTVGLFQVADEGHFAAFYDAATVDAWRTFLETGLSGDARIDRD